MYGKHFASMYEGSMMGAGPVVFAVWGYAISKAVSGEVELNPRLIAVLLGCSVEEVEQAIEYLCRPDSESRNSDQGGRRLIKNGAFSYEVVSHAIYNKMRNADDRREYNRRKQAEYRAKKKQRVQSVQRVPRSAHTEADTEADTEEKKRVNGKPSHGVSYTESFEQFWSKYPKPRRRDKQDAFKAWKVVLSKGVEEALLIQKASEYARSDLGSGQFSKMPAAWLRAGSYEDDPECWSQSTSTKQEKLPPEYQVRRFS